MSKQNSINYFQSLNELLAKQIAHLNKFSLSEIKEAKGKEWSALMVLEHLMMVEKKSLGYVKYKIGQGTKFKKAGFKAKYNSWMMGKVYRSKRKFNAPENVTPEATYDSVEALKLDYMKVREDLLAFLNELKPEQYNLLIYKHPLFGKLTIEQMLQFFEGHALRHDNQLKRITSGYTQGA